MNLISFGFLAFTALTVVLYYALPVKARPYWLLLASLFFYACAGVKYIIFLFASVLSTYGAALAMGRAGERKKLLLVLTLVFNLGILAAVKYLPYSLSVMARLLGVQSPGLNLLVPVGISFYTLQAVGYLADVYRGRISPERSLCRYSLFMSFFPIILQGPISRYEQLAPQLFASHALDYRNLKFGAQLALWGFFKKMVIADRAALLVNQVFSNYTEYSGIPVFVAMCLYTVQLYADFSGCVDISRGVAGMLGIELANNFHHPLFAVSIQDFWRRWHISLSSWFRDYVYIPLGGNRKGLARKQLNTLIVFTLSGLWHGVGINYLFWGALHGFYLVLGSLTGKLRARFWAALHVDSGSRGLLALRRLVTFFLVAFAFLFFRAPGLSAGVYMAGAMVHAAGPGPLWDGSLLALGLDGPDWAVLIGGLLLLLIVSVLQERGSIREKLAQAALPLRWAVYLLAIFAVLILGVYGPGYSSAQFIYMNF